MRVGIERTQAGFKAGVLMCGGVGRGTCKPCCVVVVELGCRDHQALTVWQAERGCLGGWVVMQQQAQCTTLKRVRATSSMVIQP